MRLAGKHSVSVLTSLEQTSDFRVHVSKYGETVTFESLLTIGGNVEGSPLILAVILGAGIGTGILFGVSMVAYSRRRETLYLHICIAVGALFARSIVGAGTVLGVVPMGMHHLIEHSLDFLIAAIVLYAVIVHAPGTFDSSDSSP